MSDRISGFTVVFKKAVTEEYMDLLKSAIYLYEGVADVKPVVENTETFLGMSQESHRIKNRLIEFISSDFGREVKKL